MRAGGHFLDYTQLAAVTDADCVYMLNVCVQVATLDYSELAAVTDADCVYMQNVCVQVATLDYSELATMTDGFSGSDLREACRAAAVTTVHEYVREETRRGAGWSVIFSFLFRERESECVCVCVFWGIFAVVKSVLI